MTAVQSRTVDITTPDGVADTYVSYPGEGGKYPGVLLYMDAFGPRPALFALVDDIAAHGYTVLLPNAFYRHGRAPVVPLPASLKTADEQERAAMFGKIMPMMQELDQERVARDSGAYLDWLQGFEHTAPGPIGTAGYCMGAGWPCAPRPPTATGSRRRPDSTPADWCPRRPTARI